MTAPKPKVDTTMATNNTPDPSKMSAKDKLAYAELLILEAQTELVSQLQSTVHHYLTVFTDAGKTKVEAAQAIIAAFSSEDKAVFDGIYGAKKAVVKSNTPKADGKVSSSIDKDDLKPVRGVTYSDATWEAPWTFNGKRPPKYVVATIQAKVKSWADLAAK